MNQRTSHAVSSFTSNVRCNITPQASNPADQEDLTRAGNRWRGGSSKQRSAAASQAPFSPILEEGSAGNRWRGSSSKQQSPAASQVPFSSTLEEGGFTVVSRQKAPPAKPKPKPTYGKTFKSLATTTPRSAAAVGRADFYEGSIPNKSPSQYKQSCLPVDQRDPVLVEAERNKGINLPKESFKPGTIIRMILHEPDFQGTAGASNVTHPDKFRTDSVHGPIYTKTRKMIVLATFRENYIAVPLYTHNGRGLEGKANPNEFVSVRDHRAQGPFTPLSVHQPLVTEHLNTGIELFHAKTAVHITYPVSRKYTLPVVHEGRLKKSSVDHLAQLFGKYILPFLILAR